MWTASQVHLHRPRSTSKQQSRSVMTGCCCQRAEHTQTNPHMAAQSVITHEDICTHRQTRIKTRFVSFNTFSPSARLAPSDIFAPLCRSKQQLCCYTSSSQPVCKPADLGHDGQSKGQARFHNKKECKPDWLTFFPFCLSDNLLTWARTDWLHLINDPWCFVRSGESGA